MKRKLKRTIAALSAIAMLSTTAAVLPEKLPVGVGITANAENSEIVESNSWLEVSCAENNYKTIDYTSSDENTYTCYVYSSTEYSAVLISVNGWSYGHRNGVLGYDNQVADLASKGARMPKFAELQILLDAGMKLGITDNFNCQEYEVAWVENGKWRGQAGNNKYKDSTYHAVFEINRNPIETVSDSIFKTDSSPTLSAVKGEDFTWQGNCDIEISYYNSDKTICDSAPTAAGNYYVKVSAPTIEADEDGNTVRYEASESDYIPFTIVHNFPDTFDSNGFKNCPKCNATVYQPATETNDKYDIDDDGTKEAVYEISNAGQLYWFAGLVNGTLDGVEQNTLANAILTANITVNENLLDSLQYDEENNVSNGSDFITWTPIADWMGNRTTQYSGTFDGNNKTVSGLYFNGDSTCIGLFGSSESDGNIKNVGVVDSYFKGNDSVGGVCGNNAGTITNCYNAGNLTAIESSATIGGICGYNFGPIKNCYYLADTEDENGGKTADQFASGEVAYLLSQGCTVGEDAVTYSGSVWGQNLATENYPVLNGKTVYQVDSYEGCIGNPGNSTKVYSNTNAPIYVEHNYSSKGTCTICGAFKNGIGEHLDGYSLSLDGNIGVNFFMELDKSVIADENAYMKFRLPNGKTSVVLVGDAKQQTVSGTTYYVFSCEVAAKEMNETITAQIITSDKKGEIYEYSVADYIQYIRDNPTEFDEKTLSLVNAMAGYGDYAKAYFNNENLDANTEMDAVTADTLASFDKQISGDLPEGITYYGSSLLLESNTTMRHYFKVAEGTDVSALSFSGSKGNYYYIDIPNISAEKLGTIQNVTIGNCTISYSPMSYAYAVLSSKNTSESLKNLVKSLYLYEQAAEAYKN